MGNQLNVLISAYEDEIKQLERQLHYCLSNGDTDYLDAYHCNNALMHTRGELYTLKHLDDPLYNEKLWKLRKISDAKRDLKDETYAYMHEYYEKQLLRAEHELELLNQVPKQDNYSSESMIVMTISRLMKNEIKNLKLILRKCDNLYLHFSYKAKALKITLPNIKEHRKKWIMGDHEINYLQELGFESIRNASKLTISLVGENKDLVSQVNGLILKIVFNAFRHSRGFENESYLQFNEKQKIQNR